MKTFSSRTRSGFVALLAVGSIALVGCGDDEGPSSTEAPSTEAPTTGMPNPASVYCEEQGGTVEIVEEPAGQRGFCNLPDGTRIDEWEYFRANN
ncbi:MAG: DUF333 domain-containing protein [Ilumatobacteraceae bacterium]